jgi:tetratricopeptide (TPR) repeat protein
MTLQASLLRELENPTLSVNNRAELCCEAAKEFEDKGEYEEARQVLSAYWQRIGEHPNVADLEPATSAELLLRAGVLSGIIGSTNQITGAQEKAKDLISESQAIFESQRHRKKIAEAQTELALCYWRTDEINEARDCLKQALSLLTIDSELKAKAVIRLTIVEHSAGRNSKALRILTENSPLFQKIQNHTLKGSYHHTLGNRLENLGESQKRGDYIDRALIEYAAASYHFEEAEHRCYLASVENNLGFLYFRINRCDEAHEHLDRARRIFLSLKDVSSVAQVDETRACVFLQQGRVAEAERVARSAVQNQEKSGRHALLAEALITHGKALAGLKRYSAALFVFRRAFEVSQHIGNITRAADAALAAFQEIGENLVVSEGAPPISGRGWGHDKRSMEHDLIKLALQQAEGSVTHAARNLGISYPSLNYMLRTRYKDLLKERTPIRRRPRKN